ncbi:MAG: MBL fold metallo-hydrolase [Nitrospira sp. SB0678_bin_10]|nr:MBL fold metallo-hydrolase [Nitrospira sp. SB0678_bin_10]MYI89276.1 MBL fold metallo-hydrolase [Gammaproteobacteria bacterium]
MKQLQEDLWQSTIHSMGTLNTHAYFLQRPGGNVLFYNTGNDGDLEKIAGLGGIRFQLLSHRDESGPSLNHIKDRFGSKLCCSVLEAAIIGKDAQVDVTFQAEDHHLGDIDIIHTPGHTAGSMCFFYKSPYGKSYLFTGDTIFQSNGKWATLAFPQAGGSKVSLADSLLRLRDLNPDVVMSSAFVGDVSVVEVSDDEWAQAIDDNVSRLRNKS